MLKQQAQAVPQRDPRPYRNIDLPDLPTPPVIPSDEYHTRTVKHTDSGTTTVERRRDGAVMIIHTTKDLRFLGAHGEEEHVSTETLKIPAIIQFDWLLDRVEVEPDDDAGMPWDNCDGWEHQLESLSEYFHFSCGLEDFKKTRGYIHNRGGRCERVVVTDESYCGDTVQSRINYLRLRGASKQVAREKVAANDRQYIDQLVEWYNNGYACVTVALEVDIGGTIYEDTCGGFEADYEDEAKLEIARNVAAELANDGYIVTGFTPDHGECAYLANRKAAKLQRLKHNLTMFDWDA
jgi:hypothetical protein